MWLSEGMLKIVCLVLLQLIPLSYQFSTYNAERIIQDSGICVIGAGASGIFAAIAAAEKSLSVCDSKNSMEKPIVTVFEGTSRLLSKVKISGGGRCNVLHDTSKPVGEILECYPRGKRELNGLFRKHFTPEQAKEWFTSRGVSLKTEEDGRMFPITDSSQTIIDTLLEAASNAGVNICKQSKVTSVLRDDASGLFFVNTKDGGSTCFQSVILATGSNPTGHDIAESLGHNLVPPVPSLFTLNTEDHVSQDGLFCDLAGLSVDQVCITLKISAPGKKKKQAITTSGPVLVTHHGLSGPAALRLSAYAARNFFDLDYKTDISINWLPEFDNFEHLEGELWKLTSSSPKRKVGTSFPLVSSGQTSPIPRRLWSSIVTSSEIEITKPWGDMSKKNVRRLAQALLQCNVKVSGKGIFKEEFVTAGGISLKEINMKTMESKICPGLYVCGEVIDVDGVTGGFNFMNCWSTGYIAGTNSARQGITSEVMEVDL